MTEVAVPTPGYWGGKATPTILHWAGTTPLDVALVFPDWADVDGHPIRWEFSLDLLCRGYAAPAAEGDITIRPDGMYIVVGLDGVDRHGDTQHGEIALPWSAVAEFQARTRSALDAAVDAALAQILAGA